MTSRSVSTRRALALLALIGWLAVPAAHADRTDEALGDSLVALLANPKAYDGKRIRVVGFVRLEFEGDAIDLHRENDEQGITKNGLWLDVRRAMRGDRRLDRKYAIVEGTFNANHLGHMDMWSGAIENITGIRVNAHSHW